MKWDYIYMWKKFGGPPKLRIMCNDTTYTMLGPPLTIYIILMKVSLFMYLFFKWFNSKTKLKKVIILTHFHTCIHHLR